MAKMNLDPKLLQELVPVIVAAGNSSFLDMMSEARSQIQGLDDDNSVTEELVAAYRAGETEYNTSFLPGLRTYIAELNNYVDLGQHLSTIQQLNTVQAKGESAVAFTPIDTGAAKRSPLI
jgi:hypothetical protein